MWLTNDAFSVQYAEEVYTVTPRDDGRAVTLLCPTRKILSRGDTLNLATMSVELEAHFDGVISCEVQHFAGRSEEPRLNSSHSGESRMPSSA